MSAGRWRPGTSGNPKGRPPGSGSVGALRQAIEAHVPAIVERLTAAALGGDVGAARLLLERVVPPLRAVELPVEVELAGQSLADKGLAVVEAAAGGRLNLTQAASLLSALGAVARIVEIDELLRRIEALEAKHGT